MQEKNNFKNRVNVGKGNKCGKSHDSRPCLFCQNVYYWCRKQGHYAKDCSTGKLMNNLVPKPPTKGRIFTLSGKEATQSLDMIKCICFLKNTLLIALFDSRATHSFISIDCVKKLNLSLSSLPSDLLISTPIGEKVSTSQDCLNCSILVKRKPFVIDLVCLPLTSIDIIIGMD